MKKLILFASTVLLMVMSCCTKEKPSQDEANVPQVDVELKNIVGHWKSDASMEERVNLSIYDDMSAVLTSYKQNGMIDVIYTGTATYDNKNAGILNVAIEGEKKSEIQFTIKAISSTCIQLLVSENDVWNQLIPTDAPSFPTSITGTWKASVGEDPDDYSAYVLHIGAKFDDKQIIFMNGVEVVGYVPVKDITYNPKTGMGVINNDTYPWKIQATSPTSIQLIVGEGTSYLMSPIEWVEGYPTSLEGTWYYDYIDEGELNTLRLELKKEEESYYGKYIATSGNDYSELNIFVFYVEEFGAGEIWLDGERLFQIQAIHPDQFFMYAGDIPEVEVQATFVKLY